MWTKKDGDCGCYFCLNGLKHQHGIPFQWNVHGRLQVAESLDPNDIIKTRVCPLCGHEERTE